MTSLCNAIPPLNIVAHRGAVDLARENTIASFLQAYQLGYKTIECDVRSCASGELVLFHDDSLSGKFWTGDQISDLSLQQLRLHQELHVATVQELFAQMPADTKFVLDLKSSGIAQRLADLVIAAEQMGTFNRSQFMATGFHHQEQMVLKQLLPGLKIYPAVPVVPHDGVQSLKNMKADGACLFLGMSGGLLHTDFTKNCRDAGLEIWAFMKQEVPEAAQYLHSLGVRTLIANVNQPASSKEIVMKNNIQVLLDRWLPYLNALDWQEAVQRVEPKLTPCGPIYELENPMSETSESFAIADMRTVRCCSPHYHANGETETYVVLQGTGLVVVGGEEKHVEKGDVIVAPPGVVHFTIPGQDLVLGIVNTPPFNPANIVEVHETDLTVGFDRVQFNRLTAGLEAEACCTGL